MRRIVTAIALCAACSSTPQPSTDASADVATDASTDVATDDPFLEEAAVQCPAPLGAPRARAMQPTPGPLDDVLHMNHIQMKATHNSYHLRPTLQIPDWDYAHAPLDVQLQDQGVRSVELDLHWNAFCERFEVYHLGTIDDRTTCRVFTQCLDTIRTWSDAHPSHHPLFIHLEPKDDYAASALESRFAAMEREILSVFPRELVITPDEVRGSSATLADAVRARGWPTLRASRGRVLFYIDRSDAFRDAYTHGGRDLAGRLAFVDSAMTDPFGGILVLNNATRVDEIGAAVRANFIVRVFSWGPNDTRPERAPERVLATGAQIMSTDVPAMAPGVTMWVDVPGGTPSRCNPLNAPMGCTAAAVESLPR